MTTYKGIKGLSIQSIAGDPGNVAIGDIWYDSVAKAIQGAKIAAGTWASGGNTNTARSGSMSAGQTYDTAMIAGGGSVTATELYNGTAWTEVNNPGEAHPQTAGAGSQTAAWMATGTPGDRTSAEEWDGTNWADSNSCNAGDGQRAGSGPQTAAIMMGSEPAANAVESYDGTSWTEIANTPTTMRGPECAGTNTASILIGGDPPASAQATETFDFNGTAFTAAADMNTGRFEFGSLGLTQDACMALGGTIDAGGTTRTANTEEYDGTSWTESANLDAVSAQGDGAGTTAKGIFIHGMSGPYPGGAAPVGTEEWTHGVGAVTFTSS
jgi:hypothetical protein